MPRNLIKTSGQTDVIEVHSHWEKGENILVMEGRQAEGEANVSENN